MSCNAAINPTTILLSSVVIKQRGALAASLCHASSLFVRLCPRVRLSARPYVFGIPFCPHGGQGTLHFIK